MKHLRHYIRNMLIAESARILNIDAMDIIRENGLVIVVDETTFSGMMEHIRIHLYQELDLERSSGLYVLPTQLPALGAISADQDPFWETKFEGNTWAVYQSRLRHDFRGKGVGALLYNVLLAQLSRGKHWLASDRESVSSDAMRIWDKWNKMPAIYDVDQMDMRPWGEEYFLTPETDDDVKQTSFYNNIGRYEGGRSDKGKYKERFLESGLTKRFQMKDPRSFLRDLEEYGILRYMDK